MSTPQPPDPATSRGRGGRRRHNHPHRPRPPQDQQVAGRAFGGQLTRINPEASTFVPASIPPPKPTAATRRLSVTSSLSTSTNPQQKQRQRRPSLLRSTAPDIATRTHEDIAKNVYECAICTNEISRRSRVWACHTCWTVFHIGCIKTWSKNEGAAVTQQNSAVEDQDLRKQWRCPGCNLPKDDLPTSYTCWCEKEINPKNINGLPPHSCGQSCGKKRSFPKPCPHPCDLICHAGPCPPCTSMGPEQMCFCGKETASRKCSETNYDAGWSCSQICDEVMPCGIHKCPQTCHEGLCGACEVEVLAKCYCGKVEKTILCNEQEEEEESFDWIGCFSCQQLCEKNFDCGEHRCEKTCHPQDEGLAHCPRSPDTISACPCGKTKLSLLVNEPRKSCSDPIPHCDQSCGKVLPCGHQCDQICHVEDCRPCLRRVSIPCRCGRNTFEIVCGSQGQDPPDCDRICRANLNCSRHECGEKCCPGERKAAERHATKRKLKPLGLAAQFIDDGIEPEHICTRVCGKKLKCGNHTCPELCHKGPCNSCKEAIFEDLTCHCGRTVLQAPLPCGSQPPLCNFICQRAQGCNHPVTHNCHTDDVNCPKCPYLTEKTCLCSKKVLKNQPCGRSDVFCGLVCGKPLKCGSHTCQKSCHRAGECEDASTSCSQICGKPKRTCGHPCERACHAPSACKEDQPCSSKIIITCDCQRKKEEVKCNARAAVLVPSGRQTSLKCDDECARLERNRKLALALHISDDHTDEHVPYSTETLKMYVEDVAWVHKQENAFRLFAADEDEKRFRFPPMKNRQRALIHSLAEDFGFDSESLDPEPHRHVLVFKTPKFVAAPMKTLAQAARIRRAALNISAPVNSAPVRISEEPKHEYNGFLLSHPRFALTEDELGPHLNKVAPTISFKVIFKPETDALHLISASSNKSADLLSKSLMSVQADLTSEVIQHNLASTVTLSVFDLGGVEPKIVHQQGDMERYATTATSGGGGDGWSKVAARRAAPMQARQVAPVGQRPVYTVLGSKLAEAKKQREENERALREKPLGKKEEEVLDSWEDVVDDE